MPKRIQRKRIKGWRMPPNTVYVGRPTIFGNPFRDMGGPDPLDLFRRWLEGAKSGFLSFHGLRRATLLSRIPELRGKNLACWCPKDAECHADILLELANQ